MVCFESKSTWTRYVSSLTGHREQQSELIKAIRAVEAQNRHQHLATAGHLDALKKELIEMTRKRPAVNDSKDHALQDIATKLYQLADRGAQMHHQHQFLNSLRYEEMAQREDMIKQAYTK